MSYYCTLLSPWSRIHPQLHPVRSMISLMYWKQLFELSHFHNIQQTSKTYFSLWLHMMSQFKSPVDAALHHCLSSPRQDRLPPPFCAKADACPLREEPLEENGSEWCLPKWILLFWQKMFACPGFPLDLQLFICFHPFLPEMPPVCRPVSLEQDRLTEVIMS